MTEDGANSVVTVNVSSGGTAFCNASNDFGTKVGSFNIKASEFLLLLLSLSDLYIYTTLVSVRLRWLITTFLPPSPKRLMGYCCQPIKRAGGQVSML